MKPEISSANLKRSLTIHLTASRFSATVVLLFIVAAVEVSAATLTIYTSRKSELITPILQQYSNETNIDISYVYGKPEALINLMADKGAESPADLLLTSDIGTLINAKSAGVLRPTESSILAAQIPARHRSADGSWYGLTIRARAMVHSKERIPPHQLTGYEDLTDPRWRGRVCMRSSENIYNRSLVAALIERWGEEATENWARGVVSNLAYPPEGGDRDQIRAIAEGKCDLTLANSYYYAIMKQSQTRADRAVIKKTTLFWPNQAGEGAHINISGGGVAQYAPNPQGAIQLLEYLISNQIQLMLSQRINEYPMIPGIPVSNTLADLGSFVADSINLEKLATHDEAVTRIFKAAGWK